MQCDRFGSRRLTGFACACALFATLVGCGGSTSPSDAANDVSDVATGADAAPTDAVISTPTCASFGGTCLTSVTESCPGGTTKVLEGSSTLCGSSVHDCCVTPTAAGTSTIQNDYGVACTADHFSEFAAGSCGDSVSCAVGCECVPAGGVATCDCSRGAPPTPTGSIGCALFNCGTITCGFGCSCADAAHSVCACP